jgi:hypothetical protein
MDTPRSDTNSASSSTVSAATTSPNTRMGSTPSTPSYWDDCKTPEPLPQAPPVVWTDPAIRVLTMQQGNGFQESDWEMNDPVELKATKAEVRTLAQHHLDTAFTHSVWFSTGWSSSSEYYRQAYHFNRFQELRSLLDAEDCRLIDEIIRIRSEYIRTLTAEQEARDAWEAQLEARGGWGPEIDAREEWEANQDPRD